MGKNAEIKKMFEIAGVDITKGRAKKLVEGSLQEQTTQGAIMQFEQDLENFSSPELTDLLVQCGIIKEDEWTRADEGMPNEDKRDDLVDYMEQNPKALIKWMEINH